MHSKRHPQIFISVQAKTKQNKTMCFMRPVMACGQFEMSELFKYHHR